MVSREQTILASYETDAGHTVELHYRADFKCYFTRLVYADGAVTTVGTPSYKAREHYELAEREGTVDKPWPGRLA